MARKTLLTEGEIRQFMKLASLTPIGTVRLSEMGLPGVELDEEEELEIEDELGIDGPAPEEAEAEADLDLGVPDDESADLGLDMAPEADESAESLVKDLLDLVKDWASDHDVVMSVEDGEAGPDMGLEDELEASDEVSMDDIDPDAGLPGDEEVAMQLDAEEEVPANRGSAGGLYEENEDIVNEVARRVAARLGRESQKTELANKLVEKIFNRITNANK